MSASDTMKRGTFGGSCFVAVLLAGCQTSPPEVRSSPVGPGFPGLGTVPSSTPAGQLTPGSGGQRVGGRRDQAKASGVMRAEVPMSGAAGREEASSRPSEMGAPAIPSPILAADARGSMATQGDGKVPVESAERPASCPSDMALVEGKHCTTVEQRCLEYMKGGDGGDEDNNRCQRFEEPTLCTAPEGKRLPMRFCMDRYEYPNHPGELPITLTAWTTAASLCAGQGKRLCTEREFTFACEGEEMRPYATGFTRESQKCNIDAPTRRPRKPLYPWEQCQASPRCRKAFARLDRRKPSGAMDACVSPFGIFDLNGNVNEWVSLPWESAPHRAGIKGGWWGPVRNRCRAITLAHDEKYMGYEVGFRCCSDPEQSLPPTRESNGGVKARKEQLAFSALPHGGRHKR